MKKKILLDVDEVICLSGFLNFINEFLNTSYEIDDFTEYYLEEQVIPQEKIPEFSEFISTKNHYENPIMMPDAIEVIEKLNDHYDIYICSSCYNPLDADHSGRIFKDKYDFLRKYLPFLDPAKYIFTNSKFMLKGDIQIDDRINNFDSSIKTKILFPSYHNKNITDEELKEKGVIRAGIEWRTGWKEIARILLTNIEK